jgi:radical SAM-linked protein
VSAQFEELTAEAEFAAEPVRLRLRLTYGKGESIKFISHQDEFRLWERAVRRAHLPLLYKRGFNPQPHIQFAAPLGVGFTGVQEYLDVVLAPPVPPAEVVERLRAKLPPAVTLHSAQVLPLHAPSLASTLIGADYTIILYVSDAELPQDALEKRIAEFQARTEIYMERQRKKERYGYNLRPVVFEVQAAGYDAAAEEHTIFVRVQARTGATGRPDEVLKALGLDDMPRTLRRDRLYFAHVEEDAARFAVYPVIEQAEIARPLLPSQAPAAATDPTRHTEGRTISERAADEFN